MTGKTLTLRNDPAIDIDASPLGNSLVSMTITEVNRLPLQVIASKRVIGLSELFDVQPRDDQRIVIQGDLARFHGIGDRWAKSELVVEGRVGNRFVSRMSGGEVLLRGDAGNQAALQMRGGTLKIIGNVGDDLAGPLDGRRSGFSRGTIHVVGRIGHYAGYRMRRGILIIDGDCGQFLGCDIVAGTIITTGTVQSGCGFGMQRGTLILPQSTTVCHLRFTPRESVRLGITTIMANEIQRILPAVATALRSTIDRSHGDVSRNGKGEIWFF